VIYEAVQLVIQQGSCSSVCRMGTVPKCGPDAWSPKYLRIRDSYDWLLGAVAAVIAAAFAAAAAAAMALASTRMAAMAEDGAEAQGVARRLGSTTKW